MLLAAPVNTVGDAKPTAFAVPLASKTAETRSATEILTTNGLSTSLRTSSAGTLSPASLGQTDFERATAISDELDSHLERGHIPGVEQPAGTVTLLFTDIEGSTRLLQSLGTERYAAALEVHHALLRNAFECHGGYEVDCEGDSFFVTFARAEDAVSAAREAQEALARQKWPDGQSLRVRMGIHTGEPLAVPPKYVGLDVHKAARIMAAGHGGQVLVSKATREQVGGGGVRDLGDHRLKDLTAPERLYQLGDSDFPPLKSLNRTNLPVAATPLIGRASELSELQELLLGPARLVTITGPGGIGKTRLALQAAAELVDEFRDGTFWVSLAPLRDPTLVPTAIAQALGIEPNVGLADYLQERRLLLVLDNAEHLPDVAELVATLLGEARDAVVLVTSRAPLHLAFEQEYVLDSLELPDAVEFFLARARSVRRDLEADETVELICRRLDRLPLALELAAARAKLLSPRAILERLDHRFSLLTGGPRDAPDRQRTLRATIDWSYDLLEASEQRLFRAFSVFVGGADAEAAEAVCGAELDDLAALVDHSLLKPIGDDRFLMLETLREYAHERLDDRDAIEERHARWYLDLATRLDRELWRTGDPVLAAQFDTDHGNFRFALTRFLARGEIEEAARLAASLWLFWRYSSSITEGSRLLRDVLRHADWLPPDVLAPVLHGAGHLGWIEGRPVEAEELVRRAVTLLRELGDTESLAWAVMTLAVIAANTGDADRAEQTYVDAIELFKTVGADRGVAYGLNDLGLLALQRGDLADAKTLFQESGRLCEVVGDAWGSANAVVGQGDVTHELGDVDEAELLYRRALAQAERIGSRVSCAECMEGLAATAADRGDAERAVFLEGAAAALFEARGGKGDSVIKSRYRQRLERVHAQLGVERAARSLDRGHAATFEEAVAFALERELQLIEASSRS
jgi:predicted ATPase/class 3 adenylate cyclase